MIFQLYISCSQEVTKQEIGQDAIRWLFTIVSSVEGLWVSLLLSDIYWITIVDYLRNRTLSTA